MNAKRHKRKKEINKYGRRRGRKKKKKKKKKKKNPSWIS